MKQRWAQHGEICVFNLVAIATLKFTFSSPWSSRTGGVRLFVSNRGGDARS